MLERISGRKLRNLREAITAYLMIAPAVTLIFVFGIFPVGFALFVSLHKWRLKRGEIIGLANYIRAIDNLIFVLLFVITIGAIYLAFITFQRTITECRQTKKTSWLLILPSILHTATVLSFIRWFFTQLPPVLDIADKIRGLEKTRELFTQLLKDAFVDENVLPNWHIFLYCLGASILAAIIAYTLWPTTRNLIYQIRFSLSVLSASIAGILGWYTYKEISTIYTQAVETGVDPGILPQVLSISTGVILLVLAWKIWQSAALQTSNIQFWLRLLSSFMLMVGGWMLIAEIPIVIAAGDKNLWIGLKVTLFYSVGTVPFQLAISLFISILLFQKLFGSELMRIFYFLPYVTPTVASAAIFKQLFSNRYTSPVNLLLRSFGLEPQQWLREPDGLFDMIGNAVGIHLPAWAGGPSLALTVIMLYSIWTFVGYNTVIYLAGLGNISKEVIEAAEIDGANKWNVFKFVIFPLLSPTTYFLSLIAIIGTFKAFNHIWVLREEMALGTTDTFSIVIFSEFYEKLRYGYASAMAFVLFAIILSLTFINNKIQGSRVFYG